jgi:hypothetical protein
MATQELIFIAVLSLALIALLVRIGRAPKEKKPERRYRYEPGWTETYAAEGELIYGHEALGTDACPTREQIAEEAFKAEQLRSSHYGSG